MNILQVVASSARKNLKNMNSFVKARLLGRRSVVNSKTRCDETKWLLLSGSNSELSLEQSQIIDPLKRSSSLRERGLSYVKTGDGDDLNCSIKSCDRCSYSGIIAKVSDQVRPCLLSPTLMRRRNAICDEIEKTMIALPGRTLRQRRVDMLRGIALAQFSLW